MLRCSAARPLAARAVAPLRASIEKRGSALARPAPRRPLPPPHTPPRSPLPLTAAASAPLRSAPAAAADTVAAKWGGSSGLMGGFFAPVGLMASGRLARPAPRFACSAALRRLAWLPGGCTPRPIPPAKPKRGENFFPTLGLDKSQQKCYTEKSGSLVPCRRTHEGGTSPHGRVGGGT